MKSTKKKTYQQSCEYLQQLGYIDAGSIPPMPARPPRHDDKEPFGVSFFRTLIKDDNFSNLTLPRTFMGRSEINNISFENTDLTESVVCWNDFMAVSFHGAVLVKADMRASFYQQVSFVKADLSGTDFRHSTFAACDFTDALMNGTHLTTAQGAVLKLTPEQQVGIKWHVDDGLLPEGG